MLEFQQKYIEDAGELLNRLESELIEFEQNTNNSSTIQELFRVMHTLKGTSGMFGFKRIEHFTHLLEDIYDLIRNNELEINREIINLTFQSVDILKILLHSKEELNSEQERDLESISKLARKYASTDEIVDEVAQTHDTDKAYMLHRIEFVPNENILFRGVKPEGVCEDLQKLGKNIYFEFTNENIDSNDPDKFNLYWEVFLEGSITVEEIYDVLLFMEEEDYTIESLAENEIDLDIFLSSSKCLNTEFTVEKLIEAVNPLLTKKTETKKDWPNVADSKQTANNSSNYTAEESIRVTSTKLDNLLNLVSDLIIVHAQFETHSSRIKDELLDKTVQTLSKLSRNFRDEILSTRLIPIAVLMTGMQRSIRDLSQKLGKEVELITEGIQTELDKNIISKIESPLMHIIRNCIDHGIETPEERLECEKERMGRIRFISFYSGASVFIQVQDDGRGINPKKIFEKAVSKGIVKYDEILTTKQIYDLIFIPGFSTATEVTEISGRGVGLDVVKNIITELHGELNIESEVGLGTSFTFKLPLTLSIIDALLVQCNQFKILIPTGNILICKYLPVDYFNSDDLQYEFDRKYVPIKRLSDLFPSHFSTKAEFEVLIIISIYEKLYGLLVDRITSSLQAVIKPLGHMHSKQPYFIGASQLGDGSIAYVLDTNFLLKI